MIRYFFCYFSLIFSSLAVICVTTCSMSFANKSSLFIDKKMEKGRKTTTRMTKRKVQSKEDREMRKTFESVAERLLHDHLQQYHAQYKSMLIRSIEGMKADMLTLESACFSRVTSIEKQVDALSSKLDDLNNSTKKSNKATQEQLSSSMTAMKASLEVEREKRSAHMKKLYDKLQKARQEDLELIKNTRQDNVSVVNSLNEDFRTQTRELTSLKEKVDDWLVSRHGFLPKVKQGNEGGKQQYSLTYGLNAETVFDSLTRRLEKVEQTLSSDTDNNPIQYGDALFLEHDRSPSRRLSSVQKENVSRIRKLEDTVQALESRIYDADNHHSNNHNKHQTRHVDHDGELNAKILLEVKDVDRKVKKLAENTSRACRSLSNGLSDVQSATLNLFTWTDQAHDALQTVGRRLDFGHELCPRAKVGKQLKGRKTTSVDDWELHV